MSENKEKNYIIVQDGCSACQQAKELFKDEIERKDFIVLDINSEKGMELAKKHKIELVPTIINIKDKLEQKCYISKDDTKIFCDDGTEKELIEKSE